MFGGAAVEFSRNLERCLHKATGEAHSLKFLLQRISVVVQRGKAAAVLGSMGRKLDMRIVGSDFYA